jgi:uncharacterized repeat protein (TIGR03803 family)
MTPKAALILCLFLTLIVLPTASAASEKVLYSFTSGVDGEPATFGGVVFDKAGNLYGTSQGGTYGSGLVFELTPSDGVWTETVLYSFTGGSDGGGPFGAVVLDQSGNLYGTTVQGGDPSCLCGTVYELTYSGGSWTETTLYSFRTVVGQYDGHYPEAALAFDGSGNLYGTTAFGGHSGKKCSQAGCGVVFKLTPSGSSWTETVLHHFNGNDGAQPGAGLVIDSQGFIYGTAITGGNKDGDGSAFLLSSSGDLARIFRFSGSKGCCPGGLILDGSGNAYGTSDLGGPAGLGAVFELTLNPRGHWKNVALHTFVDRADGEAPSGSLVFDAANNLYGTTRSGGAASGGTVFKVALIGDKWVETHLYDFTGFNDGGAPLGALVFDNAGNLYGTTASGGTSNQGVVFEITP